METNGKRRDEALLKESERVLAAAMAVADRAEALIDDLRAEVVQRKREREQDHDA